MKLLSNDRGSLKKFREDGGRKFNAISDDYQLPADDTEVKRLNIQHMGLKKILNDRNYTETMRGWLEADGRGAKILDMGCGTGIWTIEMAKEFPLSEIVGVDVCPLQPEYELIAPPNSFFSVVDVTQGLPFPDKSCTLVYSRWMMAGIRDWAAVFRECARILKPGGHIVSIETTFPWVVADAPEEDYERLAPGFIRFSKTMGAALSERGMDARAGESIFKILSSDSNFKEVWQEERLMPMWGWSDDARLREAGDILSWDTKLIPDTTKLFIMDTLGITEEQFKKINSDYLADVNDRSKRAAIRVVITYATKV